MKKQHWELKDQILNALEKYPHNSSQLSKRIGSNQNTVKRHLEELRDLHKVEKVTRKIRGEKKTVWQKAR